VYKYSKDISWLKLLQYLILLSILSPVSAKNVAGIQITGGYGPVVATHGYFNSTTVVTIEIELSDPYDDGGAEDLTNTYIYLKMGTNNDDSQLAYHQYNVKQGSATILNSAGGTIDGRTDPSGTDPDGDPDYFKFEITQADIEKNFPSIDLDDEPTWLDFVVVFEGFDSNTDSNIDSLYVDWVVGAATEISLFWDTEIPTFSWAANDFSSYQWCDVDGHSDVHHTYYYKSEVFTYEISEPLTSGNISVNGYNHSTNNDLNGNDDTDPLSGDYLVGETELTLDLTGDFDLDDGDYYKLIFTGTDIAGNVRADIGACIEDPDIDHPEID
ncbi:uncharacterized protein METZ01_LOCUS276554, partial [marine metagenome]